MKNYIVTMMIILLTACGGDSGDKSVTVTEETPPTPEVTFAASGLYIESESGVVMVIDTKRNAEPIVGLDILNKEIFKVLSVKDESGQLNGVGMFVHNFDDASKVVNDASQLSTTIYDKDGANITATVNDKFFVYDLDRAEDSKELTELAGNYINGIGSDLTIDADGNFTVNWSDSCVLEGKFNHKGYYYDTKNSVFSNCFGTEENMNGNDYVVIMATANLQGADYIVSAFQNTSNIGYSVFPMK